MHLAPTVHAKYKTQQIIYHRILQHLHHALLIALQAHRAVGSIGLLRLHILIKYTKWYAQ